jgi:carboxylesterase type B
MPPFSTPATQIGVEDCHFLNVYVPATAATQPRAVMIWLHGGAYIGGSGRSDDPQYGSGLKMAAAGVVHVTLNYRLGALGFLTLEDGVSLANLGLHDQLSALRWVRRHIASFGGDPQRVLLYGHSAGGESVLALQRMPAAAGLFHAAAALSPIPKIGVSPAEAAAAWRDIVRPTGCTDRPCLLALRASTLVNLAARFPVATEFGTVPEPTGAAADKGLKYVVADGEHLLASWAVDVPLLLSGCREQGDFGPPGAMLGAGSELAAWPLTRASFGRWADAAGVSAVEELWRLYNSTSSTPRQMWSQLGTDLTLFCGMRAVVAQRASSAVSPLYLNIFSYAVPFMYMGVMDVAYAAEGVDSWLTWGQPSAGVGMGVTLDAEAVAVGDRFRAFLVGFSRTAELGAPWRPYPAVCEYDADGLTCSERDAHARACALIDADVGRKFDFSLG